MDGWNRKIVKKIITTFKASKLHKCKINSKSQDCSSTIFSDILDYRIKITQYIGGCYEN